MNLNSRSFRACRRLIEAAAELKIETGKSVAGALLVDCGIAVTGSLEAGRLMAEICMADLGSVQLVPAVGDLWPGLAVMVRTDQPVAACMASQYAGWQIKTDDFFAMGSGPMRAAANKEKLFETIGFVERPDVAVGVLETRQFPPDAVVKQIARDCGVALEDLVLLVAPTASISCTVQVVARSVETAMHKLFELGFDLERVQSGVGIAPLPPVAADDPAGIGRTNDAILYGGEVTLWVRGDDESLTEIGPRLPSSSSPDHGRTFREIFAACDNDFYKIDPHLFSPAVVTLVNLDTGGSFRFGQTSAEVIRRSFASS